MTVFFSFENFYLNKLPDSLDDIDVRLHIFSKYLMTFQFISHGILIAIFANIQTIYLIKYCDEIQQ